MSTTVSQSKAGAEPGALVAGRLEPAQAAYSKQALPEDGDDDVAAALQSPAAISAPANAPHSQQPPVSAAQRAEQALPDLLTLFEHCVEALTGDQADEDTDPVLTDRRATMRSLLHCTCRQLDLACWSASMYANALVVRLISSISSPLSRS